MRAFPKIINDLLWSVALRGSSRLLTYIKISVVARLLSPQEFGVFGIASLTLALLDVFTETGLNIFFIQYKGKPAQIINSVWVLSILRGLVLSLTLFISAPLIAQFFNEPESLQVLRLIASVPLIKSLVNPAQLLFQKELEFNKEFYFRLAIVFCDMLVTVLAVLALDAVTGLVVGMIASGLFEVVLSFWLFKLKPSIQFNSPQLRSILSSGKWVNAAGIFNYIFHNIDDLVVGKVMSASVLGIYQMAYKWGTLPISEVGETYTKVALPTMVKLREDQTSLRSFYFKSLLYLSLLLGFSGSLLFIFATQVVQLVLGSQWLETVTLIRILLVFGILRSLSGSSSTLFYAVGKQRYVALVTLISALGLMISLFPLIDRFGIQGAAWATIVGTVCAMPVMAYGVWQVLYNSSHLKTITSG